VGVVYPTQSPIADGFALERRSDEVKRMPTDKWAQRSAVRDDEKERAYGAF